MEFTYLISFMTITVYSIVLFDPVLSIGTSTIVDVRLLNGKSLNEGRLEYMKQEESSWSSPCSEQLDYNVASVVCTQLGYPGVNIIIEHWPFGMTTAVALYDKLECTGEEENLASCRLSTSSVCLNPGPAPGIICQENGYIGCYSYTAPYLDLRNPCDNGVQNLTIPRCISLCSYTSDNYTYSGLYNGDTCLCGNASSTFNKSETMEDWLTCNSPCIGRNSEPVEYCGGASHIALFNITLYLENTNRTASPPRCQETTSSQTEGARTATASTSSPLPSPLLSTSSSSTLSSSSTSPISSSSSSPTSSSFPSTPSHSSSTLFQSSQLSSSSPTTSTSSSSAIYGLQIGLIVMALMMLVLLLYGVIISLLYFRLRRRKVSSPTEEVGPDPYIELQPRSEVGRTYQEMIVTPTASSKGSGERCPPRANLIYENQTVAQYAQ